MSDTAAAPPPPGPTPSMKLLIDTASQLVLFAEAGKEVIDFLFGVLATPVGAVASLLLAEGGDDGAGLGSVGNVYASAEKMDAAFMQGADARDALVVNTTGSPSAGPSVRLVPNCPCDSCTKGHSNVPVYAPKPYQYPPGYTYPPPPGHPPCFPPPPPISGISLQAPPPASDAVGTGLPRPPLYRCHACNALGTLQGCAGFVQGVATYTVMDDLAVTPTTSISSLELLKKLGVKDLDAVEQRTVGIGRKECLEILKASFRSKAVLTDVFLATRKRARTEEDKNRVD